jgi:hypothetical protein
VRRDPPDLAGDDEEQGARISGRAWGVVLGAWIALFAFLGLIVLPILFATCGAQ